MITKEIRPGADAANGVGPERKSIYCVDILDIPSIPGTTINQLPAIVTRPLFIVWCTWRPECMISYGLHPFFTDNHEVFNDNMGDTETQCISDYFILFLPRLQKTSEKVEAYLKPLIRNSWTQGVVSRLLAASELPSEVCHDWVLWLKFTEAVGHFTFIPCRC